MNIYWTDGYGHDHVTPIYGTFFSEGKLYVVTKHPCVEGFRVLRVDAPHVIPNESWQGTPID